MLDFNKLAASANIKDKLKAVQDPACPGEIITAIMNHDVIDWTNKDNATLTRAIFTLIVSHQNTDLYGLMSIFSYYGYVYCNELDNLYLIKSGKEKGKEGYFPSALGEESITNLRKLIIKHARWNNDNIISILIDNIQLAEDGEHKCFMVGSITDADVFDDEAEKYVYQGLSKEVNSIFCLCQWALQVMEMGDRDLAETLLNQAPKIKTDLCDYWDYKTLAETTIEFQDDINKAEDAYEPASAIYEMAIAKAENMDQWNVLFETEYEPLKMTVLKNPGCPKEILLEALEGDNDNLKKVLADKLKPAGFGRFADPNTGEFIAKMQDGKLAAL
jgi:hypothetical protein